MNYFFQIESSRELKEFKEELIKRLLGLSQLIMHSDTNKNRSLDEVINLLKQGIKGLKSRINKLYQEKENLEKIHKQDQENIKELRQTIEGFRLANTEFSFKVTIMKEKMDNLENDLRIKFEKPLTLINNEYKKFREEIDAKEKQIGKVILLKI